MFKIVNLIIILALFLNLSFEFDGILTSHVFTKEWDFSTGLPYLNLSCQNIVSIEASCEH